MPILDTLTTPVITLPSKLWISRKTEVRPVCLYFPPHLFSSYSAPNIFNQYLKDLFDLPDRYVQLSNTGLKQYINPFYATPVVSATICIMDTHIEMTEIATAQFRQNIVPLSTYIGLRYDQYIVDTINNLVIIGYIVQNEHIAQTFLEKFIDPLPSMYLIAADKVRVHWKDTFAGLKMYRLTESHV